MLLGVTITATYASRPKHTAWPLRYNGSPNAGREGRVCTRSRRRIGKYLQAYELFTREVQMTSNWIDNAVAARQE